MIGNPSIATMEIIRKNLIKLGASEVDVICIMGRCEELYRDGWYDCEQATAEDTWRIRRDAYDDGYEDEHSAGLREVREAARAK